jgi:hypothetical protein
MATLVESVDDAVGLDFRKLDLVKQLPSSSSAASQDDSAAPEGYLELPIPEGPIDLETLVENISLQLQDGGKVDLQHRKAIMQLMK